MSVMVVVVVMLAIVLLVLHCFIFSRYFMLAVALHAYSKNDHQMVHASVSDRIIVRVSNINMPFSNPNKKTIY